MKKFLFVQRSNGSHWVGDGFPVRNIFSYDDIAQEMSPFLLLDYAGPAHFKPTLSKRGVGEHPHRGFETVTIVYSGEVEHRDSSGGGGIIGPGDVQWMTAGAGVVHEEFHGPNLRKNGGVLEMVQLWVNLPAAKKMTDATYRSIVDRGIPRIELPSGAGFVRVIAGRYKDSSGPAHTFTPMNVWDVRVQSGNKGSFEVPEGHSASVFVLKGRIRAGETSIGEAELSVFAREGNRLEFSVLEDAKLLILTGKPLNEPIVGYGPFVMNSPEEIKKAIVDYESGQMGNLPVRSE